MASILTDCANKIGEKLMNTIIAEARYICCFKCIIEDFEKEKEDLKETRDDATFRQQQLDNLIEEDTKRKKTCLLGWCPNCIWRYHRGKELAQKTEEIRRLRINFESGGLTSRLPDVERHSSNYIHFKSRESKCRELLEALIDDNNYIIGLQGLGGTGKTTLAKEVGKKLKKSKQFDLVIDTTVSSAPDIKTIQDEIAGPLGLPLKDCTESDRPKKLWKKLMDEKKILIILDDVWTNINFEEIGIPYNHKGCRVLLTTRDLGLCNIMQCQRIIQLEILPEDDAWKMFKIYAGISDNSNLKDKGQEIAKECKGVPVAIAAIASTLRGQQGKQEWNAALTVLQNEKPMGGVDENLIEVYNCLKYSYDNMKNENAKKLFLLCSVFKEDENFTAEFLTMLVIGVSLFGEADKYDIARSQVVLAINKLRDSCLLLESNRKRYFKMHDMVREVAQWIAEKKIKAVDLSNRNQKASLEREKNIRYLLCRGRDMDVFSCLFDGTNLEILFVEIGANDFVNVPNAFFKNMTGLSVLILRPRTRRRLALSLPQSIQSLTNIRALVLRTWKLGDISTLGTLRSLETLNLYDCSISELPNKITELEKLRFLWLEQCHIESNNPFEVIERCPLLETLHFIANKVSWLQCVKEAEGIHQNRNLPALQGYLFGNVHVETDYPISRCVCLSNIDSLVSEAMFKYLVQRADTVRLIDIKREWRNLLPDIVSFNEDMNDLVELGLSNCSKVQCLIDTNHIHSSPQRVFPKLKVLKFTMMDNLVELCSGPLPVDFLKSLKTLRIFDCGHLQSILFKSTLNLCNLKIMEFKDCPMLVSLFQLSTARSLVLLESLRIHNCEQLTDVITPGKTRDENEEGKIEGFNDHKSCDPMFPKLKTLDIEGCDRIEFILPVLYARDVPVLETIIIHHCQELKYIFRRYQHEDQDLHKEVQDVVLGSLKKMTLTFLPKLLDIFGECYHLMPSSAKRSPSRDGSKAKIQSNPIKCDIFSWSHLCFYPHKYRPKSRSSTSTNVPVVSNIERQDFSISLTSKLKSLHLLESVECLSKQSQVLRSVRKIILDNLPMTKFVFILSIAPTMLLEELTIKNCDELKHIIIDTGDDHGGNILGNVFPKLKILHVKSCGQLQYIFGQYPRDHQNYNEINLHLPALENLKLCNLPNVVGIGPKNYSMMWPSLREFELNECPRFTIKSIGDLIVHLDSRQLDSITKEITKNVKHFLTLERLTIENNKIESIFHLNDLHAISQQISLRLQSMVLHNLPQMTFICMGPKYSFILQNLKTLRIVECEKLEVMFPTSIVRCLPQLDILWIEKCEELKHIIEDDVENHRLSNLSPKPCFPMLRTLIVTQCSKLKCFFPVSASEEHPKLEHLIIHEASMLEKVFKSEQGDEKIKLPKLTILILMQLPRLCHGIELHTPRHCVMHNCQNLSSTSISSTNLEELREMLTSSDVEFQTSLRDFVDNIIGSNIDCISQGTSNESPTAEKASDTKVGPEVQVDSGHGVPSSPSPQVNTNRSMQAYQDEYNQHDNDNESKEFIPVQITKGTPEPEKESDEKVPDLEIPTTVSPTDSELVSRPCLSPLDKTHSHELVGQQPMFEPRSTKQQQPLGETEITIETPQGNNYPKETEDQCIQKISESEKNVTATPSIDSKTSITLPGQSLAPLQKRTNRNVEERSTSDNAEAVSLSTHSAPVSSPSRPLVSKTYPYEDVDGQISKSSFSVVPVEHPATKKVDVRDSQEASESVVAPRETHAPVSIASSISEEQFSKDDGIDGHVSNKGQLNSCNLSQVEKDSNFASLVIRELEQLIFTKHLASENLSLLTDFLIKHPSVRLMDSGRSNKYKGFAYSCLADLLKFLQTHSALDVLGSSRSEFVDLLQDVRGFSFDKDWLDAVERRAFFPDLEVSQDALQKLLDSKQQATQKVEVLRLKTGIFAQHVEDLKHELASSEAALESVIQQEVRLLKARATLSAPLGY